MNISYCLECAKPLNQQTITQYDCENGHSFWNNPKTAVAVVILKEGKILVSKRGREPAKDTYDLPGGFLEYGEDPFAAAVREMTEETTLTINQQKLQILTAYAGPYWENETVCDLVVFVPEWSGNPIASDDSAALEWQDLDFLELPEFNPPYDGLKQIIEAHIAAQERSD
jgi:ADP-ribose pyrophosphatase YjhB (NUDIX family)